MSRKEAPTRLPSTATGHLELNPTFMLLKKENDDLRYDRDLLATKNAELQDKLDKAELKMARQNKRIEHLSRVEERMGEIEGEAKALREHCRELEAKVCDLERTVFEQAEQIKGLEDELCTAKNEIERLREIERFYLEYIALQGGQEEYTKVRPTGYILCPWQRPPPRPRTPAPTDPTRTLTVPDDFKTISAACMVASAGDTVFVRCGHYNQRVVLKTPINLIAETAEAGIARLASCAGGAPMDVAAGVVLEAGTTPLLIRCRESGWSVSGFTIRQVGTDLKGMEVQSAVEVAGVAELGDTISHCTVTSQSGVMGSTGMLVGGGGSPTIRACRFINGGWSGLTVSDESGGEILENEFASNAGPNVVIKHGCDPLVQANRIHDGEWHGVVVAPGGKGTLHDNQIYANQGPGVLLGSGCETAVLKNTIHLGSWHGIVAGPDSRGAVLQNEVHHNKGAGFWMDKDAEVGDVEGSVRKPTNASYNNGRGDFVDYRKGLSGKGPADAARAVPPAAGRGGGAGKSDGGGGGGGGGKRGERPSSGSAAGFSFFGRRKVSNSGAGPAGDGDVASPGAVAQPRPPGSARSSKQQAGGSGSPSVSSRRSISRR